MPRLVPDIGGVFGGTVDAVTTKTIGRIAISTFLNNLYMTLNAKRSI
jgi:hypothetical protein